MSATKVLPRPDLVLLDLDGTLVDSAPDLSDSVNHALNALGLPKRSEAQVRNWIGGGAERLVKRALTGGSDEEPEVQLFAAVFERFSAFYLQHVSRRSRLYPGVREGLDYLARSGRTIGCVTNKRGRYTEPLLRALGIDRHFAIVVSGDTLPRKKPDPLPLLHAVQELHMTRAQGMMIGDSVSDVKAARAAGLPVVCVRYGYSGGRDVAELGPDSVIDSLAELAELI